MITRHSIDHSPRTNTMHYSRVDLLSFSVSRSFSRPDTRCRGFARDHHRRHHPRVSTHGYTGLCTRSDGYICSLFRRVFVFTGTLFTTGQQSHKYATRSADAFCSPVHVCTFAPTSARSLVVRSPDPFVRTFVRSVASFRGTFISTIICGDGRVVVICYTTILPSITRTANNDNELPTTG